MNEIADGPEPENDTGPVPETPPEGTTTEPSGTVDEKTAADLRREAANYRRQLRDMENKVKAYELAQMSEAERVAAERDELRAELNAATEKARRLALESAVVSAATRAGLIDPDVAVALVASTVSFDEDGAPVGVDEAVAELVRTRPYLANGTKTIPGAPPANPVRDRTAENGARVYRVSELNDRKFYEQHRDDILAAVSDGRIVED